MKMMGVCVRQRNVAECQARRASASRQQQQFFKTTTPVKKSHNRKSLVQRCRYVLGAVDRHILPETNEEKFLSRQIDIHQNNNNNNKQIGCRVRKQGEPKPFCVQKFKRFFLELFGTAKALYFQVLPPAVTPSRIYSSYDL